MADVTQIDLALLRAFRVLVAAESVTRAADRLGIGQPAMSYLLAKLRRAFGDPLLVRAQQRMVPTAKALELDRAIEEILARVESLQAPAPFDPAVTPTDLTVTGTEFIEYVIFPRLMHRLAVEAPAVSLVVRPPHVELAKTWLERGEIDFRIGSTEQPPPTLRSRPLFRDRLVSMVRKGHPALEAPMTLGTYTQLGHIRVEVEGKSRSERAVDAAMAAQRQRLRLSLRVRNYLTIPHIVAESDLVATLPLRLARSFAHVLPLVLFEPPIKLPVMQYSIYWHERTHASPQHRWLRNVIAEVARSV